MVAEKSVRLTAAVAGVLARRILPLACAALVAAAHAEDFGGKVVSVSDGDTVSVLAEDGRKVKVRLAGIDCPEKGQPWGPRAARETESLASGKAVSVEATGADRYGRTVGRVLADGKDLGRALVGGGHCWVYPRYAKDRRLFELHDEARKARRGLWSLPAADRIPPWEWRRKGE